MARVDALTRRGKNDGPQTKLLVGDLEMDLLSRMRAARWHRKSTCSRASFACWNI